MLLFNSTFVFSYFAEQFFGESLQLNVCSTYQLSVLQTPASPPETRPNVWCVQCCHSLVATSLMNGHCYRLQATGLCS
jgi:hypothetical protein